MCRVAQPTRSPEDCHAHLGLLVRREAQGPRGRASAIAFLQSHPVSEPYFYLMVHTPEGVFGRDKDGIFNQPA